MLDVVIENILRHMEGLEPLPKFDGHANCFIESGFEKGVLIDLTTMSNLCPASSRCPVSGHSLC